MFTQYYYIMLYYVLCEEEYCYFIFVLNLLKELHAMVGPVKVLRYNLDNLYGPVNWDLIDA